MEQINCWKCGASNEFPTLKIGRSEACRECHASLHVCRQCRFYAPGRYNECHEPVAERVTDKTRANFCDYFVPNLAAYTPQPTAPDDPRKRLDVLFGAEETATPARSIDDLFK